MDGPGNGSADPPTAVDLLAVDRRGADGALWSLPHGGDLDANLVHLAPGGAVDEHVNHELDVLVLGLTGAGTVMLDGAPHALRTGTAIALPKGARRAIAADQGSEVLYVTVHRARAGLRIGGARR